ncbi:MULTISPECIES: SPOR domain-containing protein [unclassified Saccharicrinis]|uniref:SPOR domain-containing protein n=1 Tax=unclassified Saccharicrinis TaxID=2646859 RepID=UPI003D327E33
MNLFRYKIWVVFTILLGNLNAQVKVHANRNVLSESDVSKMVKADSYINQGNEILFANFTFPKDSLFQLKPNYIKLTENLYAGKRVSRLLFETKDYYKTGFKGMINVYQPYINQYLVNEGNRFFAEVQALKDSVAFYTDNAEKFRSKSKVIANLKKGGEQIHKSNLHYQQAVLFCQEAIGLIGKDTSAQKQALVKETVQKVTETVETIEETVMPEKTEPVVAVKVKKDQEVVEPGIKPEVKQATIAPVKKAEKTEEPKLQTKAKPKELVQPEIEVYYTVQIMADKTQVSQSRIKQVYAGKYAIVENKGDGWYRYSFGKFSTLSEAKTALSQSNTKGYIVAYKGKVRISLSEARAWFAGQVR